MRMVVPKEISALTDVFTPYIVKNNEGTALILKKDAPNDAKVAHKKYCDWWETNHRQP